jgi:hypothetical protein
MSANLDNFDMYRKISGFSVYIATSARTTSDARCLLSAFGLPFLRGPRHVPKKPIGGLYGMRKMKQMMKR